MQQSWMNAGYPHEHSNGILVSPWAGVCLACAARKLYSRSYISPSTGRARSPIFALPTLGIRANTNGKSTGVCNMNQIQLLCVWHLQQTTLCALERPARGRTITSNRTRMVCDILAAGYVSRASATTVDRLKVVTPGRHRQ